MVAHLEFHQVVVTHDRLQTQSGVAEMLLCRQTLRKGQGTFRHSQQMKLKLIRGRGGKWIIV